MRTTHILAALVLSSCFVAQAQSTAGLGALSGTIWDQYGEQLPDVSIVLTNDALNFRREMNTNIDGVFHLAGLVPSTTYKVHASRKGYSSFETKEFQIAVGQTVFVQVTLEPTPPTISVNIPAELPPSDPTRNAGSTSVTPLQIDLLPVSGRHWEYLALLAPAVTTNAAGTQLSLRGETIPNLMLTDGIPTGDYFATWRPRLTSQVTQDAVQEFQVATSDYSAEFGTARGGLINAVTRAGTKDFHGTAYEYAANHSLAATDRYALGNNLFGRRNQFGGSVGGPARAGDLFFFTNFEVSDAHQQALNRITNPAIVDPTGTFVLASNCKATAAQCAAATRFIQSQMNVLVPRSEHSLTGLARLDYIISENNHVSAILDARHGREPENSQLGLISLNGGLLDNSPSTTNSNHGKVSWINSGAPGLVNELSLGIFDDRISNPISPATFSTGMVGIDLGGTTLGATRSYSGILRERRLQVADNIGGAMGSHILAIGVLYGSGHHAVNDVVNASGTYSYTSLTSFAQDLGGAASSKNYAEFSQRMGVPVRTYGTSDIGLYVQDTWAATRRLRVTAGIRWDYTSLPSPANYNSDFYLTDKVPASYVDFAPRVGAAYALNNRTTVRTGYSLFYAPYTGELLDALMLGGGADQVSVSSMPNQTGSPVFANAFPSRTSFTKGQENITYAGPKFKTEYTKQFSFALEREVGWGSLLSASFLDNRGTRLWTATDYNLTVPANVVTYNILNAAGSSTGTYNMQLYTARNTTSYEHVYQVDNNGNSTYRALEIQLRKRVSHGFGLQASYTWSHAIDNVGGPLIDGGVPLSTFNNTATFVDKNATRNDEGNSATDQRHRVSVAWTWQPVFTKSTNLPARFLVNGWELSSIATFASGQPATATVLVQGQQFSTPAMLYTTTLNGSDGWSRVPFLSPSSLRNQAEYNVNARLARTLPFTSRIKGVLAIEAFNVFNSQWNTGVNTLTYIASGGSLRPVSSSGVGNLASGYGGGSNARSCQAVLRVQF